MKTLTEFRHRIGARRGFTLAETLMVVVILLILFALLIPNLIKAKRNLRQKELDAKAEILYVAAQNRLAKLRASGTSAYTDLAAGATGEKILKSNDTEENKSWMAGAADASLLSGNWVIVYDAASMSVKEVYYCEKLVEETAGFWSDYQKWSQNENRTKGKVGFYNGDAVPPPPPPPFTLKPEVRFVSNREVLKVRLYCKLEGTPQQGNMTGVLTVSNAQDQTQTKTVSGISLSKISGSLYQSGEIVLDGLLSNENFKSKLSGLTPGCDLQLGCTVTLNDETASTKTPLTTFNDRGTDRNLNSLFYYVDRSAAKPVAYICCGRHLQNLDTATSGVDFGGDFDAVQTENIYFDKKSGGTEPSEWKTAYADRSFIPISNAKLSKYEGRTDEQHQYEIHDLNAVANSGAAGLFSTAGNGMTLSYIKLINAKAKTAGGNAGALVGTVNGRCTISDCQVYLTGTGSLHSTDAFVEGTTSAGGLVGARTGSSTLTVEDSLAATLVSTGYSGSAGGLIGCNEGDDKIEISRSYADCYVTGASVGGLIGSGNASEITSCYAAGFLAAPSYGYSAGLVYGRVTTLTNTYTVCAPSTGSLTCATVRSGSAGAYYLLTGGTNHGTLINAIPADGKPKDKLMSVLEGAVFTSDTKSTRPYGIDGKPRTSYDYPRLKGMTHYGDWYAEFESGSLAYYEIYANGAGFSGGNINCLSDSLVIVDDGYGVVLDSKMNQTVTVVVGETTVTFHPTGDRYTVNDDFTQLTPISCTVNQSTGSKTYYIYPLPASVLFAEPAQGAPFWQSVTVNGTPLRFNPFFAKAIQNDLTGGTVYLRSPRHLRALSEYYGRWTGTAAYFKQERDINFAQTPSYQWTGWPLTRQALYPIGSMANPFVGNYDGGCHQITGVSISTGTEGKTSPYGVGLFASNGGILQNIVLAAEVADGRSVSLTNSLSANQTGYIGALVGYNSGYIYNCAVAGYSLKGNADQIKTYGGSTLRLGGLVGCNAGTGSIDSCSAVLPIISLDSSFSDVAVGSMVGQNSGSVRNSAATTFISADASRGTVSAAGFAGSNAGGQISGSYCVVAIEASDSVTTCGFAPAGGYVSDSYFLNDGTYYYLGVLHSFGGRQEAGVSINYETLAALGRSKKAASSVYYGQTQTDGGEEGYPFPAVVHDALWSNVHYGDWISRPQLGMYGVFYWEHEEEGSNPGYHFSFLGRRVDTVNGESPYVAGSTLCTAHDDSGVVTAYGYGYYYETGSVGITMNHDADIEPGVENLPASTALGMQMPGFTFHAYTTGMGENDLRLVQGSKDPATNPVISGKWTLSADGLTSDTYVISPFFANAMSRDGAAPNPLNGADPKQWDAPGTQNRPYQVRSVQQLQFINWNCATDTCDQLVTPDNYQKFPYLQYATEFGAVVQKKTQVEANRPPQHWKQTHDLCGTYTEVTEEDGKQISTTRKLAGYTPIAGMATSTEMTGNDYSNYLYAWFGGCYDGRTYKIKNLDVISPAYSVGLFGVTVGADVRNVIMFSDDDSCVKRQTEGTDLAVRDGAYNIGGLIGIAYEYYTKGTVSNKLENCAVAGYTIWDASTNRQGAGTGNVGGLVGVANMNLTRCAAVTKIYIDCTHAYGHMRYGSFVRAGGLAGSAGVKDAVVSVDNCYTGGSIVVSESTLNEAYGSTPGNSDGYGENFAHRDAGNKGTSINIFASGLISGSYSPNMTNITALRTRQPDGTANINNCYTYMQLPDLRGNVRAVSLFANQGDRYGNTSWINLSNCHYYGKISEEIWYPSRDDPNTWPDYFPYNIKSKFYTKTPAPTADQWTLMRKSENDCSEEELTQRAALISTYQNYVISSEEFREMLHGNLRALTKYLNMQGPINSVKKYDEFYTTSELTDTARNQYRTQGTAVSQDYDTLASRAMPGTLGGEWGKVTVGESGEADGRYSFSDHPAQAGKNYPFPTVIRQVGLNDDTPVANVHYGAWPLNGDYWTQGRPELDIFADLKTDGGAARDLPSVFTQTLTAGEGETFKADLAITDLTVTGGSADLTELELSDDRRTATVKLSAKPGADVTVSAPTVNAATEETEAASATICLAPAEKAFTLYLPTVPAALPAITDFTLDPADMAQVVAVGQGTNPKTGEADPHYVAVTLRALRTGFVSLTYAASSDAPSCSVSITATSAVADSLEKTGPYTTDPVTIRLSNGGSQDVWCRAQNGTGTVLSGGRWKAVSERKNNADMVDVVTDVQNDICKITILPKDSTVGDCGVTVTYAYNYYGSECTGTMILPVRTMGYIGLSNGTDYVSVSRVPAAEPAEKTANAENNKAPQGADLYLFASATEGDLLGLAQRISGITITDGGSTVSLERSNAQNSCIWQGGPYTLAFFHTETQNVHYPQITADAEYQYYGATLRTTGDAKEITVTVTLSDPLVTDENSDPLSYTLTVSGVHACKYAVTLAANGGNGEDTAHYGIYEGAVLPANSFTRAGYRFTGWNTAIDGSGTAYLDRATVADDPDDENARLYSKLVEAADGNQIATLYAQWAPVTYTVQLHNGTETVTIDADYLWPLPGVAGAESFEIETGRTEENEPILVTFTDPADGESGYVFDGWTGMDGTIYQPGAQGDQYLPASGIDTLHFTAHWKENTHTLTLTRRNGLPEGEQPLQFEIADGTTTELEDYQAPTVTGWELMGWYDANGAQVLKPDGTVFAAIANYTAGDAENGYVFDLNDDARTLYSYWMRTTPVYVKVDALTGEVNADGAYLLTAAAGTTTKALTLESATALGSADVTAENHSFFDRQGNAYNDAALVVNPPDNAKWTVAYCNEIWNNKSFIGYRISAQYNLKTYYLKLVDEAAKNYLSISDSIMFNSSQASDRCVWLYSGSKLSGLNRANRYLSWLAEKSAFGIPPANNGVCGLFRETTVYSYDPSF